MARFFLCCLLAWLPLICSSGVRPLVVVGASMQPSLQPGQLVLLHRDYYHTHAVREGDVVAFRWKGRVYVKRVYAVAGQRVQFLRNGDYSLPLTAEQQVHARRLAGRWTRFEMVSSEVPPGHFFSLGDHRTASTDSREFGPIPNSAILGRVQSLWGSLLPAPAAFTA